MKFASSVSWPFGQSEDLWVAKKYELTLKILRWELPQSNGSGHSRNLIWAEIAPISHPRPGIDSNNTFQVRQALPSSRNFADYNIVYVILRLPVIRFQLSQGNHGNRYSRVSAYFVEQIINWPLCAMSEKQICQQYSSIICSCCNSGVAKKSLSTFLIRPFQ